MHDFDTFLSDYPNHLDSPEFLSKSIIQLAAILYEANKKIAQAELDEARIALSYLDQLRDGKKMAVSEAEKRALADTNNSKHLLQNSAEAVLEMIQSLKKRIEVLSWERKTGKWE